MDTSIYIVISTLIGNVVGWFLKNKTEFRNRLIPVVMVVMMALKNLLIAAGLLPQEAATIQFESAAPPDTLAMAAAFPWQLIFFVVNTVLDAALPIGTHSMTKNLRQR